MKDKYSRADLSSIYDVLVRTCGALETDSERELFVLTAASRDLGQDFEYRFQGRLGFGGKVWLSPSPATPARVSYDPEDGTEARARAAAGANEEFARFEAEVVEPRGGEATP